MATVYNQTDTSATFNVGDSGETAAGGTAARTAGVGSTLGSTETTTLSWTFGQTVAAFAVEMTAPGVSSWDGTWTVNVNVTTADGGDLLQTMYLMDKNGASYNVVTSGGSVTPTGVARGGTGVYTGTFSVTHTPNNQSNSQPYVLCVWNNNDPHGGAGSQVTPNQTITAPYTLGGGGVVTTYIQGGLINGGLINTSLINDSLIRV